MEIDGKYTKKCKRYNLACHAHELTFSCYRNRNFMSKERVCHWLVESIEQTRVKLDFALWAYVFMPNHVHLLIYPRQKEYSISQILKCIKQPVARKAVAWLKQNNSAGLKQLETSEKVQPYRFWQKGGGYDRNIIQLDTLINSVKYIHRNPVRKELVELPEQWYYSSAAVWKKMRNDPMDIDRDEWPS